MIALLAFGLAVSEPRVPAGGPGGNARDATISIRADRATTHLRATLVAPPATPWLSTGFPFSEATPLWSIESDAASLELRYLFPMRGTYAVRVDETRRDGAIRRETRTVAVPEDPTVLRTDAGFVALLLGVGAALGFALAGGLTRGRVAPHAAALALLATLAAPALAGAMPMGAGAAAGAKPGTTFPLVASVAGPAIFELRARNVEDDKPLLAVAVAARDGRLRAALQFYDGAAHAVRIRAMRDGRLVRAWRRSIAVASQAPPLGRRAWALALMLAIFAVGYFAGTGLRLRTARAR
ncbi:MAG: hypothetical protein NVSMB21_22000 [Vulcanimicrobiaceae bacterium]